MSPRRRRRRRRSFGGKPEVRMRARKATPERRMSETSHGLFIIPQSSSSITSPLLLCDLLRVTQLLHKLPSHILNGVWGHFVHFFHVHRGNRNTSFFTLKAPETGPIQIKVEWSHFNLTAPNGINLWTPSNRLGLSAETQIDYFWFFAVQSIIICSY